MGKIYSALALILVIFLFFSFYNVAFSQSNYFTSAKKFFVNGQSLPRGIDVGIFPDTPTRVKVDLSGDWLYSLDEKVWRSIPVPSAYDFEAKVVFQRKFEITDKMLDTYNFFLVAYGINYQSEIHINGNFVGRHMGGYSSFIFPIRENVLLVGSENNIKVSVNNFLTVNNTIPLRQYVGGWRNYGGIFRDIYLLATPKLFISETQLKSDISPDYKSVKLRIKTLIENVGFKVSETDRSKNTFTALSVEVSEKLTNSLVGRSALIPFEVPIKKVQEINLEVQVANPKLWSPDTPDLYLIKLNIIKVDGKDINTIDEFLLNYGIRDIRLIGNSISINNNYLFLKGLLWIEDHHFFGSALTYETMEKDVVMIKTTGANLIRFLYPPHPYMLNLCDRYGILVMIEIPVSKIPAEIFGKEYYTDVAQSYAKEMVLRDRNHPSVIAWGIGSNLDISEKSLSIATNYIDLLSKTIRNIDDRPIFLSLPGSFIKKDFPKEILDKIDLVSIHTTSGVEGSISSLRQELEEWKRIFPNRVLIGGKYGKVIDPKNRNGYSDPFSLEAQARYAWQAFETIRELKLAGGVLWAFNDWLGDRPSLSTPSGNPFLMAMGIVSSDRERRVAYDVMRNVFSNEKVTALPVGNYSSSAPIIYVITGLLVLITLAFVYNSNRRIRENINRSLTRTYNFFADIRDQRIIPVSHSILLAVLFSVTMAIITSSILTHYRYNILVDNILSQFFSDSFKEWIITIVWQPPIYILYFSLIFFISIMFLVLMVMFFSLFVRVKVYLYHGFSITIWSFLPMIILIPISMILFRILETQMYVIPSFVLLLIVKIWVIYRLFKGISIIFDVNRAKVVALGIFLILAFALIGYAYLDYTHSTSVYLRYLLETNDYTF